MEKIALNQKKDSGIFISITVGISIFLYYLGFSLKNLIETSLFMSLFFTLKIFWDYIYNSRLKIGEKGIMLKLFLNEDIVTWNDLTIKTRILNRDQREFIFKKNEKTQLKFKIDYLNNQSFTGLVKKYCPHEHELYKAVQEYAKENNIPF